MKFVEIPGKGNADISFYNVECEAKTIGGLLQQIYHKGGFGDIEILVMPNRQLTRFHYKYQQVIEIPNDFAQLPIKYVTASGGWGRTDYQIYV